MIKRHIICLKLSVTAAPLFTLCRNASVSFYSQIAKSALIGQLSQAWSGPAHHASTSALAVFLWWLYGRDITLRKNWQLI